MQNRVENEKKGYYWDEIIPKYNIYTDTCSLMEDKASIFYEDLIESLVKYNKNENKKGKDKYKLIIPMKVALEVKKHKNSSNTDKSRRARQAEQILKKFVDLDLLDVREDIRESFADNVFMTQFTRLRMDNNICFITQDRKLSIDIYNLNNTKSVRTRYKISIVKIGKNGEVQLARTNNEGELEVFKTFRRAASNKNSNNKVINNESVKCDNCKPKFNYVQKYNKIDLTPLKIVNIPKEGDVVKTNKFNSLTLGKCIGKGAEGSIYLTSNKNIVCKIYNNDGLSILKYNKLLKMLSVDIKKDGVCWPIDMVYNSNNKFTGYIMPKAEGEVLKTSIFMPQRLKMVTFPKWNKEDLVDLCINILDKINYLHKNNIILGDINPFNIMVKSKNEIYFVDTDSYQIEEYPCIVGTVDFTAPEIQGKDYKNFLRSFEHEYFSISTLLFMILLPGKSPYACQGGGEVKSNIIKMEFPYPSGATSTGKAPEGTWRYIWSNLPRYLKDDLYNTFSKNGEFSKPQKRKDAFYWLNQMKRYKNDLSKKNLPDEEMYKIFATRLKRHENTIMVRCTSCLESFPKQEIKKNGMCKTCSDLKGISLTCVECGKKFEFTNGEVSYYKSRGFDIPKRCGDCRAKNTNRKNSRQAVTKYSHVPRSTMNKKKYITNYSIISNIGIYLILAAMFIFIAKVTIDLFKF